MATSDTLSSQTRHVPNTVTGKRKRGSAEAKQPTCVAVQVITGSYERVLHGITAFIPISDSNAVTFSNNFLFNAHASSIRCLAVSPPSDHGPQHHSKRILATGSSDERINLYQISCAAPDPSVAAATVADPLSLLTTSSAGNRELGSLLHHNSAISALHFPSRNKLLSASYDNNIAVTRVRDWTLLSTIHAPIPKPAGRPSGDTAGLGDAPAGINAVAIHPSAKLCLSVGQGERCMRLWNLVTGRKAGVLTFDKTILGLLGEGRWRGGEGRQVVWSEDGEEFAVSFERGAIVYGLDCAVRGLIRLPGTKLCQMKYLPGHTTARNNILAMATEDGRMFLYDTNPAGCGPVELEPRASGKLPKSDVAIFMLKLVATVGANERGPRIKDFDVLPLQRPEAGKLQDSLDHVESGTEYFYAIITGSSEGAVRVWRINGAEVERAMGSGAQPSEDSSKTNEQKQVDNSNSVNINQKGSAITASKEESMPASIGTLLGTFETRRRITCLTSFMMAASDEGEDGIAGNVMKKASVAGQNDAAPSGNGSDVDWDADSDAGMESDEGHGPTN